MTPPGLTPPLSYSTNDLRLVIRKNNTSLRLEFLHVASEAAPDKRVYSKTFGLVIASLARASRARRGDLNSWAADLLVCPVDEGHTRTCAAHYATSLPRYDGSPDGEPSPLSITLRGSCSRS